MTEWKESTAVRISGSSGAPSAGGAAFTWLHPPCPWLWACECACPRESDATSSNRSLLSRRLTSGGNSSTWGGWRDQKAFLGKRPSR